MVIGIGQCCWDYLAVVDAYPAVDSKKEVSCWHEQGGGPVATALVTLRRLEIPCRFHGVVGDDDLGNRIIDSLVAEGIDVTGVLRRTGAKSQRAFISIEEKSGLRTIFWQRPTGEPLAPAELGPDFLQGGRLLLLDGLMVAASLFAAGEARRLGIPVMLDAGRIRPGMLELAALSDYLVAGEQFFLDLGWDGGEATFDGLASKIGAAVVTVTLGERGSLTWHQGKVFHQQAFSVEVVDTTGAGDVFHGAYAYGLLQEWQLEDTVAFASAVAALKCRQVGGRTGIPALGEALAFFSEQTGRGAGRQ